MGDFLGLKDNIRQKYPSWTLPPPPSHALPAIDEKKKKKKKKARCFLLVARHPLPICTFSLSHVSITNRDGNIDQTDG